MTTILYGIPNCDTVKKARTWLGQQGIEYAFHDYKKAGITPEKLKAWCGKAGWDIVLNRAGTTFKKLSDSDKKDLDQARAISLMCAQPSMIRRPIVEHGKTLLVGFKQSDWAEVFRSA
ncbi:MAG: arsenate reductase [Hyphomicrobiaceae bacterium]